MKDFWKNFKPAWFKWLVVAILGGAVLWWAFGCTTDARASTLDEVVIEPFAQGDSIAVRVLGYTIHASVDSGVFVVTATGQADQRLKVNPGSGSVTFVFEGPDEGQTMTGQVRLTSYKAPNAPMALSRNWTYTAPVGPNVPPTIDSITVEVVEQALLQATPVQDIVIANWQDTCQAEWATLGSVLLKYGNVIRAKGVPPAWCHEYLVTDTAASYTAKSNWLQVKFWREENQA